MVSRPPLPGFFFQRAAVADIAVQDIIQASVYQVNQPAIRMP
jgi:hypothetical protein